MAYSGRNNKTRRGRGKLTPVEEVVRSLMERLQMPEDMDRKGRVFTGWAEAAGDAAGHATPFRFRGDTLVVEVDGPVWMNELGMRKRELVARLNRAAGDEVVKDIRFQLKKKRD